MRYGKLAERVQLEGTQAGEPGQLARPITLTLTLILALALALALALILALALPCPALEARVRRPN